MSIAQNDLPLPFQVNLILASEVFPIHWETSINSLSIPFVESVMVSTTVQLVPSKTSISAKLPVSIINWWSNNKIILGLTEQSISPVSKYDFSTWESLE